MLKIRRLLFFVPVLLLCMAPERGFSSNEEVTLQLKGKNGFRFAGYYAALERGYYKKYGLDVKIVEADTNRSDPQIEVISGRAQYGISDSSIIVSRAKGIPLVALMPIFQHTPIVLISKKSPDNIDITSLIGKKVMLDPGSSDEIKLMFKVKGVDISKIQILPQSTNISDFIYGDVYAMSAHKTEDPYALNKKNFDYVIFAPSSEGIDFYGDILFTTDKEVKEYPDRVEAFTKASLEGWKYAINNPEEIYSLILKKYKTRDVLTMEFLQYESGVVINYLIEPTRNELGYMNEYRWKEILNDYADLGLVAHRAPIDWDKFMYTSNQTGIPIWMTRTFIIIFITIIVLAASCSLSIYFFLSLKRSLKLIKRISGMLPICANCKKIRNDTGYWNKVEDYIKENSDANFTHSICPDCAEKLYGLKNNKKNL